MLSYINMFMVDYKTEQDALWESLDDAFPSIELKTNLAALEDINKKNVNKLEA